MEKGEYFDMVDLVTIIHNDMNRSFAERLRVGLELYEPDNYRLIVRDNFAVNLGFAKGCNWGAKQATSDIIGFVNPDVIVHGAFLDRVSEVFTDENVVITGESFREPGHAYGHIGLKVGFVVQHCLSVKVGLMRLVVLMNSLFGLGKKPICVDLQSLRDMWLSLYVWLCNTIGRMSKTNQK